MFSARGPRPFEREVKPTIQLLSCNLPNERNSEKLTISGFTVESREIPELRTPPPSRKVRRRFTRPYGESP